MNELKVLVSPNSELAMCGGDCTDLYQSNTLVYNYAYPEAKAAVGCRPADFACVPYTRELLILAWGAGGWAGAYGPDFAWGAVGDWAIATASGMPTPHIEANVGWQLTGLGVVDPNVYTLAHELNHNISWDDPHDFSFDTPQTPVEIAIAQNQPWLYESLADKKNPSVTFQNPAPGSTVSGTISVQLSASDQGQSGMDAVTLLVDGYWSGVDLTPPYTFSLDTTKLGHGPRKLTAVAYDNAGHIAKAEITINVNNVVSGPCSTSYPLNTGLVCYFDGIGDTGPYLGTLVDHPNLVTDDGNFGWWPKHHDEPVFGESGTFTGVWRARLNFPAGTYRFNIFSDDGVRFYVNDTLVLDEWRDPQVAYFTPQVTLSGNTNLKIEWYQSEGGAHLEVNWQPVTP